MLSGAFPAYRVLTLLRMGVATGVAGVLSNKLHQRQMNTDKNIEHSLALKHFRTSSLWPVPRDHQGPGWEIRNDYPHRGAQRPSRYLGSRVASRPLSNGSADTPWTTVDFKVNPLGFCDVIKQYCWEGNVENCFVVQRNRVRLFYPGLLKSRRADRDVRLPGQELVPCPVASLHKPREGAC
jgi:hypothetical protein